ncbi:hypothetical protein F5148DRAFT_1152000 [Russula earlei]|uniref:Uncharacterized protein n=1 Tax=Russula earlei TaxID=71964 RepID=A0ACC0TZN1_9AGAM|nr:hypothetical protein F5148DRAFT_1152000 [Russula earlei]
MHGGEYKSYDSMLSRITYLTPPGGLKFDHPWSNLLDVGRGRGGHGTLVACRMGHGDMVLPGVGHVATVAAEVIAARARVVGGNVGGGVQCAVGGGGFSCGDGMVVAVDCSVGWRCRICSSEAALFVRSFSAVRGGIMASDGSERAVWSGSRVVAGTRPGMAADEAEGEAAGGANSMLVAAAGNAGDMTMDKTKAGAWTDAGTDGTGSETFDGEVMGAGMAGGAMVMATEGAGDVEAIMGDDRCAGMARMTGAGVGDVELRVGKGYVKSKLSSS